MADEILTSTTEPEAEMKQALGAEQPQPSAVEPQPEEREKSERAVKREIGKWASRLEEANRTMKSQSEMIDKLLGIVGGKTRTEPAESPNEEPKIEQFGGNQAEYQRALSRWTVQTELASERAKAEEESLKAIARENFDSFVSQSRSYSSEHPEYVELLGGPSAEIRISNSAALAIIESENGPAIHHFLLEHPDKAEALAQMSDIGAALYIGKLDAQFEKQLVKQLEKEPEVPARRTSTSAPAPIEPLRGSGPSAPIPIDKMTSREYREARRAGRIGRPVRTRI